MNTKIAQQVLNAFRPLLEADTGQCGQIGRTISIPTFSQEIIIQILEMATSVFEKQDLVLELKAPMYIVGDIHGNIFDLIRILTHTTAPPHSRLLFLGDYVDRGEYSVEVVVLLFSLMVCYPDCVYVLRGNHEFEMMNFTYGFMNEIIQQFGNRDMYDKFNDAFQYMPLVATLNNKIFCVHGGISPTLQNVSQINKIKRPLTSYEAEFVSDLVWSDPVTDTNSFNDSQRGLGVQFGVGALKKFLEKVEKTKVLRAHQCVMQGVSIFGDGLLYTVFSSSNYADAKDNRCGLLFVSPSLQIEMFSLPMLVQVPRGSANIKFIESFLPSEMTANESLTINIRKFEEKPRICSSTRCLLKVPQKMKAGNLMFRKNSMSANIIDLKTVKIPKAKSMDIEAVTDLPRLNDSFDSYS